MRSLLLQSTERNKAHRMSSTDDTQNPPTTTVPDLVFYILRTILARLTNAGSLLALEQVTKAVRITLEKDYLSVIKNKLEDVYRVMPPSAAANRSEKQDSLSRRTFIVRKASTRSTIATDSPVATDTAQ